ncbi:MAG TPA: hypothetical protein VND99_01145 [Candidatus Acidoferrales bacterium]|nr:hypothetical protein [Candidatus Acidoferrales bacterium]
MLLNKKFIAALLPFIYLLILLFQKDLSMIGDLGRHLKIGQVVLQCHCVPQTNLFSYTNPNFPIVNHEWLAEVVFYLTSAVFGVNGLLILKMILVFAATTLIYIVALKKGSLFWVTIFSLVSITIFSMRFFVLPELFSYVFIGLFLFLIERYKKTKKIYLLWFLPILEILWVNMHIYFIIGIILYVFFFLETWIIQKKFSRLILIIGITLVFTTLINPSGIRGALLPFTFQQNYGFVVEENESPLIILNPSSTNTNTAYTLVLQVMMFELLIVLFAVGFFLRKQWKEIFHMGSGTVAVGLALKFTRCISLFSLLGFIPLVQTFTRIEEKIKDIQAKNMLKGIVALGVLIVVGVHITGLITYKILGFGYEPSAENAVAFMKQANVKGKIFNNYIIGNYLIYGLYPQERVFVDARPEAYPSTFFPDYWRMLSDPQFFNQQVEKYNINAVVFNVATDDPAKVRPFLLGLLQSKDWVPVYGDGVVTIFVRDNQVNKTVIDKYRININ